MSSLKIGIQRWLDKVEKHYGVRPIIYTSKNYYATFLKSNFAKYPLWVANYNKVKKPISKYDWMIWQYSKWGKIDGINGPVDLNMFNGNNDELKKVCIN